VLFDLLYAPLYFPDGFEMRLHAGPIGRAQLGSKTRSLGGDGVENTGAGGSPRRKQLVEHNPRIHHHRQRRPGRSPGYGLRIDAAIVETAGTAQGEILDAELKRRYGGVLSAALRVQLIDGRPVFDIGTGGLFGVRGGEEDRAGTKMIGASFGRRVRFGRPGVGAADDREVVAKRREGFERIREIEIATVLLRAPVMLARAFVGASGGAVHHFNACQAAARRGGGAAQGRLRGHHRIQKRQRQGCAHAAQDGASREVFPGEEHRLQHDPVNAILTH
jgi:hypothetical protein